MREKKKSLISSWKSEIQNRDAAERAKRRTQIGAEATGNS